MKQTNLRSEHLTAGDACAAKLAVLWGGFGAVVFALWEAAGPSNASHALVWGVALALGAVLALGLWEGRT